MKSITVDELNSLIGKINIIDIKESCELGRGLIPTSKHIPATGIYYNHEFLLDKQKTYYIICFNGVRSLSLVKFLEDLGYDAINVRGGTYAYSQKYKLDTNKKQS
jgi:rhodanese-related sulfurtransferase